MDTASYSPQGGVGGLIGAFALIIAPQFTQLARVLVVAVTTYAIGVIAFALVDTLILAAVTYGLVGATIAWWANTVRTLFQLAARDEMRGRVMSLFGLISQTLAFGALLGGASSELIGPQMTLIISSLVVAGVHYLAYLKSSELRNIGRVSP